MLESLFGRVAGQETPTQVSKYCEIFKNTYFQEHLQNDSVWLYLLCRELSKISKRFKDFV